MMQLPRLHIGRQSENIGARGKEDNWTSRKYVTIIGLMVILGTTHHLGEGFYLTPRQLGTLQCVAKTQKWSFTARKLLVMLYPDDYLKERCAVGKDAKIWP